jgi:hypothetical protein
MAKQKLPDAYSAAITKLEADLAEVDEKLKGWRELMQKRQVLQAALASLRLLSSETGSHAGKTGLTVRRSTEPLLWEKVRDVLQADRTARSPGEVARALNKLGRNDREIIRQAMNRKADVFVKLPDGKYGLQEWNDAEKTIRSLQEVS